MLSNKIFKISVAITAIISCLSVFIYSILYTILPANILIIYLKNYQDIEIKYSDITGALLYDTGLNINNIEYNNKLYNFNINIKNINFNLSSLYKILIKNKNSISDNSKTNNINPSINPSVLDNNFTYNIFTDYNLNIAVNKVKIKYNNTDYKLADLNLKINNSYNYIFYELYYDNNLVLWKNYKSQKNYLKLDFDLRPENHIELFDFMPKLSKFNINADISKSKINWQIKSCFDNLNILHINGHTNLSFYIPKYSIFNITTTEPIILANNSYFKIHGSPNIKLKINSNILDISGNININKGLISVNNKLENKKSSDIVIIDESDDISINIENNKTNNINLNNFIINTNIDLIANNNKLVFKTPELNTKLNGKVKLIYKEDKKNTTGLLTQGEIKLIDGEYLLLGKKLKIKQGLLLYNNSPIDNPNIKILAERKVKYKHKNKLNYASELLQSDWSAENINQTNQESQTKSTESTINKNNLNNTEIIDAVVGINAFNTLNNIKINLYSSVYMSEADKISYLLFGVPSQNIDESQGQILLYVAQKLFADKNNMDKYNKYLEIFNKIKAIVNINELNIENRTYYDKKTGRNTKEPTLILGTNLLDKILLKYTSSLNTGINTIAAEYKINNNLKLVTQYAQNGSSSADLVYSKETDKLL